MDFKDIFETEYDTCDRFIAKACRILFYAVLFADLLNNLSIFDINKFTMNILAFMSVFVLLAPSFIFDIKANKKIIRYINAAIIITYIGILYSFLTFHVVLLFIFPVVIFNIYGDRKLIKHVMIETIIVMTIAHIAGMYFSVCPEEPFKGINKVILYGLIPKICVYLSFAYAFVYETNHNNNMARKIFKYSQDMHETQTELVKAFSEISESKSGQTGQHVKRVSSYVEIMANELGITGQEKESLVIASMMHDVGKLMISSDILDKPGKLTEEEFNEIKKHTEYGYELLKKSPGRTMEIGKRIALEHHERWDGHGYTGIKGDSIDYYSRIVSIADVFDALVSKRSYKDKWNPEDAYNEIVSQRGKQFDPELVDVFKKCYPKFLIIVKEFQD